MSEKFRKKNRRRNLKTVVLWLLVALFLSASVFLTIDTATSGAEVSKLEKEEQSFVQKNRSLTDSLVKSSSLNSADEEAGDLGFEKPELVIYISQKESVAEVR